MAEIKWTPTKEKLPELSSEYLVTEEFAGMRIVSIMTFLSEYVAGCFFRKRSEYDGVGFYERVDNEHYEKSYNVVAWAELPDAYMDDLEEIKWTSGKQ